MRIVYFIIVACAVLFTTACSTTGGAAGTPGYSGEISKRVPIGAGIDAATTEINRAYGRTDSEPAPGNCNVLYVVQNNSFGPVELTESTIFRNTRSAREQSIGIIRRRRTIEHPSQLYRTSGTGLTVRNGRSEYSLAVPYWRFCREGTSDGRQDIIGIIINEGITGLTMKFGDPLRVRQREPIPIS